MSILGNPTKTSPERAFALQKYLLLHSQHDALLRHLENISQPSSQGTSVTSPSTSTSPLSTSPPSPGAPFSASYHNSRRHQRSSSTSISFSTHPISPILELPPSYSSDADENRPSSRPYLYKRRSSLPTTLSITPALSEIEEEEQKLQQVNQQIKTTLTELLNCDSVRTDRRYRMWIQTRLMDAERELKGGRSRSRTRRTSIDHGH